MNPKNIHISKDTETLIPISYIDSYQDPKVKAIFGEYKFKNARKNKHLLNLCIDICIDKIVGNPDTNIVFAYPPSTMFYRKEKSTDSMGNLIVQTGIYLNFYFRQDKERYYFKNLFSINRKYLKNKKAQHIDGGKSTRIKDLNKRYYLGFWNGRFLKKLSLKKTMVVIIDDVSSTGGTLLACKNSLTGFDVEVELWSLAH